MHWYWWIFGLIEVSSFFYFSYYFSYVWRGYSEKTLKSKLFNTSLWIRLVYVAVSYCLYWSLTGTPFEFSSADALWYDDMGRYGAEIIWGVSDGNWANYFSYGDISDHGYPLYLSFIYAITGKSVILTRILKAFISSATVLLVYKLASRNFGKDVGRISAVFCMLMPNLIYYCGLHLKETEMLFLTILFIERADAILRSDKVHIGEIMLLFAVGAATFFFRAVLCYVLFLTLAASIILGSKRIKKGGKWAIGGLLVLILILFGYFQVGNGIIETDEYQSVAEHQNANMQWRSERHGGNAYAKYASASLFAPLIFTIPFPTMVNIEGQQNQQMIHGGNFVKNITSFFTILALIMLLVSGRWRDNIVPLAFMLGYLIVLAFSSFAQSERFHIPSLPFELMFASYAITQFKAKHKGWFALWIAFIFFANLAWAWFKLRGRGL